MEAQIITREQALKLDEWLMSEGGMNYCIEQLMELAGRDVARCIIDFYNKDFKYKNPNDEFLFLVGGGNNGGDGLVAARFLCIMGYNVSIYSNTRGDRPHITRLMSQFKYLDVKMLSLDDVHDHYRKAAIVVDCIVGVGFSGEQNLRDPWPSILQIKRDPCKQATIAVDVPSGWKPDVAASEQDNAPACLIALSAPKRCALNFPGAVYLAGLFISR